MAIDWHLQTKASGQVPMLLRPERSERLLHDRSHTTQASHQRRPATLPRFWKGRWSFGRLLGPRRRRTSARLRLSRPLNNEIHEK
jgi:hypothetical protein